MAKTEWSISMDFNKAKKQAEELEQIAADLDSLAKNNMTNWLVGVGSNWQSENAKAYIRKGNTVKGNIEVVAKSLRNAANTMRQIAKNTYDTEKKALEMAKRPSTV